MNLGLVLLRVIIGGIFAVHGFPKLFGGPEKKVSPEAERYLGAGFTGAMQTGRAGFAQGLRKIDIPMPEETAFAVGVFELLGGLFLILGWFVRPLALLFGSEMGVAIWKVHWKNGLIGPGGFEFNLSLIGGCLALLFGGRGSDDSEDSDDDPNDD